MKKKLTLGEVLQKNDCVFLKNVKKKGEWWIIFLYIISSKS